jgi:hypothetical protein
MFARLIDRFRFCPVCWCRSLWGRRCGVCSTDRGCRGQARR